MQLIYSIFFSIEVGLFADYRIGHCSRFHLFFLLGEDFCDYSHFY